jgi:serine/threonine-protein kinase
VTEETGSAAVDASSIQTGAFDVGALGGGGQIAGYRVEAEIGHGGMATVYRALDVKLGRRVALKILAPRLAEDDSFRQRFIHESRAAAAVDHPHIVPVFEAGESGGVLFIAMRYVGTGDVRTLLERQGRLPVDRAVAICAQVASALDAANGRGLVHRDVKPANMLLAESAEGRADHVYLSDFGLSKHSLAPSGLTATGQFMGTLDYVAPEQIEGRVIDGRADQYALACAVVEMLTGQPPFRRNENIALMWAQLSESPPSLRERRPELPEAIDRVISRALAKSPAERFPACMDFAAALRAASVAEPPGPLGPPGAVRTPTELARHLPQPTPVDPLAAAPGAGALAALAGPAGPPAQWGRAAAPADAQPGQGDAAGSSPSAAPTSPGGRPSAWGQGAQDRQADVADRPSAWEQGQGESSAAAEAGLTGLVSRPSAWGQGEAQSPADPSQAGQPGQSGQADGSAAWGQGDLASQGGPPSVSQPGQTGAAPLPAAWGQSAQSPASTQESPPQAPGASQPGQPDVARQAALWGREAQPGQAARWGQAARLGQADLSAAPTSGMPPVPPVSYRSGSPAAPPQQSSDSPWSASPWPASAAANPASSVSQPASPAPWSSPPGAGGLYRPGSGGPSDRQVQPDLYRSAPVPAPTAPRPRARKRRRGPGATLGIAAGIVVLIALAALGYKLVNHGKATNIGAASATRTVPVPPPTAPAAVVRAYFAAINHHNYGLAWRLGGKNTGRSKAEFVSGFVGTAHDSVRILGQSGDSVRARVIARQTNGTRKFFQGTYRVVDGAIVHSHIRPVLR